MADNNSNPFNKFMDDICKREEAAKSRAKTLSEQENNTPQRRYNQLYRERWQNQIRWGGRKK